MANNLAMVENHDSLSDIPNAQALRKGQGRTLEDVAAKIGCTASALSRYESGKRRTPLTIAKALAKELKATLEAVTSMPVSEAGSDA